MILQVRMKELRYHIDFFVYIRLNISRQDDKQKEGDLLNETPNECNATKMAPVDELTCIVNDSEDVHVKELNAAGNNQEGKNTVREE